MVNNTIIHTTRTGGIDGSSGPCGTGGGSSAGYVDSEVPGGVVDGANTTFSVAGQPNPSASLDSHDNFV